MPVSKIYEPIQEDLVKVEMEPLKTFKVEIKKKTTNMLTIFI